MRLPWAIGMCGILDVWLLGSTGNTSVDLNNLAALSLLSIVFWWELLLVLTISGNSPPGTIAFCPVLSAEFVFAAILCELFSSLFSVDLDKLSVIWYGETVVSTCPFIYCLGKIC